MRTAAEFFAERNLGSNQFFTTPGATRTVLVSSHIWWTDLIALAFLNRGFNVLCGFPWYQMYTEEAAWGNIDNLFHSWLGAIKQFKVDLVIGGNSTAMAPHPKTKELLHEMAGVPVLHYWWDEPRTAAPFMRRGFSLEEYVRILQNEHTLNVFWDVDVQEEMTRYVGVTNGAHVPLGATPDFWPQSTIPLAQRKHAANFLGHCHFVVESPETSGSEWVQWAYRTIGHKRADWKLPMTAAMETANGGIAPVEENLSRTFERFDTFNAVWMHELRNKMVLALGKSLGERMFLVGKGWEKLGLTAAEEHTGVPKAGEYYGDSVLSLNLFGGCVHGGMPLRPYEIACSNGLIFTQMSRELGDLFEVGKECVAFANAEEMLAQAERVLAAPQEYEGMIAAGRKRVVACHTWEHRVDALVRLAKEKFNLPW